MYYNVQLHINVIYNLLNFLLARERFIILGDFNAIGWVLEKMIIGVMCLVLMAAGWLMSLVGNFYHFYRAVRLLCAIHS